MADSAAHQPINAPPSTLPTDSSADVSLVSAMLDGVSRDAPRVLAEALTTTDGIQPEIELLLRDIGALTDDVRAATTAPVFDIESLHADIERALADAEAAKRATKQSAGFEKSAAAPAPTPPLIAIVAPPRPTQTVRVDPLLAEIDAALADNADSLVARADGDVRSALASVFDEGALAGLDDEINRALIEAFGTSRLESPTYLAEPAPRITNPVERFNGIAKQVPPDTELDIVAATMRATPPPENVAPPPASEAVSTHAPPIITPVVEAEVRMEHAPSALDASTPETLAVTVAHEEHCEVATAETGDHAASAHAEEAAAPKLAASRWIEKIKTILMSPLRLLMHETVHQVLAALAVATSLAVPIAWYSAWRQSQAPAVGRVAEEVLPLTATADAAAHAEPAKAADAQH